MRRTLSVLLAAACALALNGCGRKGDAPVGRAAPGDVDTVVSRLNSFTAELTGAVESAADTKAGVDAALGLLDARRGELSAAVAALKADEKFRRDAEARRKWLEAEVDGTDRVHRLRLKYSDAAARDPALKSGLDRLVADYDALFKDR